MNVVGRVAGRQEVKRRDLSGLDRNLELLTQELALRGSRLFSRTTSAACASASVSHEDGNSHFTAASDVLLGDGERIVIRERTAREEVRICAPVVSPPRFETGLIGVGQGLGAQQHFVARIAGAPVKNRTSCRGSDWKGFTLTRGSPSRRADLLHAAGRGDAGGNWIRTVRMQPRLTVNRYHGRGLV